MHIETIDTILSKQRKTKALIRLRRRCSYRAKAGFLMTRLIYNRFVTFEYVLFAKVHAAASKRLVFLGSISPRFNTYFKYLQ